MKLTLGVLAHVDAGKTTLSERLLFHANAIRSFGRVDLKNAYMDYSDIERERGITVFSDAARLSVGEDIITLIDTPGHVDFSAETERAISVLDYAVLVVSAIDGVQSHTETIWRLLREYNVPTFFFINKTDAETADLERAFSDIRARLTRDVIDFFGDFSERLAEYDEALLEEYLKNDRVEISDTVRKLVSDCCIFPCFHGSALHDQNIERFISGMRSLMCEEKEEEALSATCYKIRRAGSSRLAYFKVNSGTLKVKSTVNTPSGERKIDEIKLPSGEKLQTVAEASRGEVCAVLGLSDVLPGDTVGDNPKRKNITTTPVFSAGVVIPKEYPIRDVLEKFRILEEEDPTLSVRYIEQLSEIEISVMGKMSLQVLEYEIKRRFGLDITFGPPRVLYRETVKKPTLGYGHYEPLRHYAEVHIIIEPREKGHGVSFRSECSTDVITQNFQNAIRTHVFEKKHLGVLTGSELTDVEYVLKFAKMFEDHTVGGDMREATYRAIRHGLMYAENVLLEPFYKFTARSDAASSGKIMADVGLMGGEFEAPYTDGERTVTCGRAPARLIADYVEEITSSSGGRVSFSLSFDGYEPCRDQERIVREIGYEPDRDIENSPDSIFCARGAGYHVKWNEVSEHIHFK